MAQEFVDKTQNYQGFVPPYEGSIVSSDFINVHAAYGVKEGDNFMGFTGGLSSGHVYTDPGISVSDFVAAYGFQSPPCYRGGVMVIDQPFTGNNGGATTGQSLSLSLSSQHTNNLPLKLNLQRNETPIFSGSVPLGPLTGYSSVLKGSRFLKPAQQLLVEICDVGRGILEEINGNADTFTLDILSPLNIICSSSSVDELGTRSYDGREHRKRSELLSMLDEVFNRYKQYYQQMQTALAAFESVAGLSGAAPFASLALKAMSKHFGSLKNAIMEQLQLSPKIDEKCGINECRRSDNSTQIASSIGYGNRATGFGNDPPVWRPQRGLPERAVSVLKAWLFEHFLHPYPTDTDKIMLANQTGLTRNQVSNWFINARVRLWKPMVEEIHMLETHQNQGKASQKDQHQQPRSQINDLSKPGYADHRETTSAAVATLKRTRRNLVEKTIGVTEGGVVNTAGVGLGIRNGGVSLTLGLHQDAMGLPDSYYSINAVRRLGLDLQNEGHLIGGFTEQSRMFGMGNGGGGQVMREFVG